MAEWRFYTGDSQNYSNIAGKPGTSDDAKIKRGILVVDTDMDLSSGTLTIDAGTTVTINSGVTLTCCDITNNGTLNNNGIIQCGGLVFPSYKLDTAHKLDMPHILDASHFIDSVLT